MRANNIFILYEVAIVYGVLGGLLISIYYGTYNVKDDEYPYVVDFGPVPTTMNGETHYYPTISPRRNWPSHSPSLPVWDIPNPSHIDQSTIIPDDIEYPTMSPSTPDVITPSITDNNTEVASPKESVVEPTEGGDINGSD